MDQIIQSRIEKVAISGHAGPPAAEQVFVGCSAESMSGLVLDNKALSSASGRSYGSITRLMADPPPGLLEGWPLWAERPVMPEEALRRIILVVEDASPDSVMGIILLLVRLAEGDPSRVPLAWVNAIDLWEREGVADDPWTTWASLASALAHRRFGVGTVPSEKECADAWTDVLRFAARCLERNLDPFAIPTLRDVPEWVSATTALQQERQVYLDWLARYRVD
jgi:hypothetical protein